MRILFLTNNLMLGSTARILQNWLPLIPSHGLTALVVTPPGSQLLNWARERQIIATSNPMPWPNCWWPFPSLWHAYHLARWAQKHGVDIIHCNEHNVYPFALLLRRFLPLPCHVRYRIDRGFSKWVFSGRGYPPDALLWTSRQQQSDSADAIDSLVPPQCQHIVPLGFDLATFGHRFDSRETTRTNWGIRRDQIVIGQAAPLRPRKRLEDFVALVTHIAAQDERVVGVLAGFSVPGDEPYRDRILQLIQDSGLGSRFLWLGQIDDIEPFYQACDIIVSTSEYETFGNSVCEAMACSRPVIAYRGGSVAEVLGESGIIVENGDLDGLIQSVLNCVRDPTLIQDLGQRARERVAQYFNPKESLSKLHAIYCSLVHPDPVS